jgi:hypothetical protein
MQHLDRLGFDRLRDSTRAALERDARNRQHDAELIRQSQQRLWQSRHALHQCAVSLQIAVAARALLASLPSPPPGESAEARQTTDTTREGTAGNVQRYGKHP